MEIKRLKEMPMTTSTSWTHLIERIRATMEEQQNMMLQEQSRHGKQMLSLQAKLRRRRTEGIRLNKGSSLDPLH